MRLIVTNGDHAVERLRAAGIEDEILPWRDVLHDGPVPAEEALERLSQLRASFLSSEFGLPHESVAMDFAVRDSTIRGHARFPRLEIWLENDLYDQLQLIQILDFLGDVGRTEDVFLAQTRDPIGRMGTEAVARLAESAEPVTQDQFTLARIAWTAFTAPHPAPLAEIASEHRPSLPYLAPALKRLLAELPDPVRGLSLTQERVLEGLQAGPARANELFRHVVAQEEAQFMGDASFFHRLEALAFVDNPLIDGVCAPVRETMESPDSLPDYGALAASELRLTATGRNVLAGNKDHALINKADTWIGGVRLSPALLLRYDREKERLIAPA
jgi:hypothetical protein